MEATYTSEGRGRVLRITLHGEVDHHNAAHLRTGVDGEIYLYRPQKLELSLKGVTFMDSAGLGFFMGRYELCRGIGAGMVLLDVPPDVQKILTLSGFDRVLCREGK